MLVTTSTLLIHTTSEEWECNEEPDQSVYSSLCAARGTHSRILKQEIASDTKKNIIYYIFKN
jgi:hypothetical protein